MPDGVVDFVRPGATADLRGGAIGATFVAVDRLPNAYRGRAASAAPDVFAGHGAESRSLCPLADREHVLEAHAAAARA